MKRTVCFLLVLCCVFTLCACGSSKTPFDGVEDAPTQSTVLNRYGKNYSECNNSHIKYDSYKWLGYDGELELYFENGRCVYATWEVNTQDQIGAYTQIRTVLSEKCGNQGESGSNNMSIYTKWFDSAGRQYTVIKSDISNNVHAAIRNI